MDEGAAVTQIVSQEALRRLEEVCPGGVCRNVDLARVSRWRVGGSADCIVAPASVDQLAAAIGVLRETGTRYVTLGSTTNLLFSDLGLRAVGLHIGHRMSRIRIDQGRVWCEAGFYVPRFARRLAQAGLAGGEHVAGIPGTLGGLICMNGGSQRRGIGENVTAVTVVDARGAIRRYAAADCGFAYRRSIFQENGETIAAGEFLFSTRDDPSIIRGRMMKILADRRGKFPQKEPNCGSVFVSDPAMYADYGPPGAVIERLGLKGRSIGGAQVSPRHANFVVNTGKASSADVIALVTLIRDAVRETTGYTMRPEGKFVRADGTIVSLC